MTYSPDEEGEAGLRKLCSLFFQAASQFYLDTARRLLALHAERRSNSPELNARVAFKVRKLISSCSLDNVVEMVKHVLPAYLWNHAEIVSRLVNQPGMSARLVSKVQSWPNAEWCKWDIQWSTVKKK